jgi:hypothetical protein
MRVPPVSGNTRPGKNAPAKRAPAKRAPGRALFAGAGLVLLTAAAAACSGGAPAPAASTSSSGTTTSTGNSTSTDTTTTGGGAVKNFDVCTALPAAAASQITGTTFTKTKSSSVQGVVFGCDYDGPNSALLQISVETQFGKSALANDVSALKTVGHPPRPVSGVGDEAFSEPDPKGNAGAVGASAAASYGAVFGSTYIKVGGLTYVTAAQGKQIVEQLHAKM